MKILYIYLLLEKMIFFILTFIFYDRDYSICLTVLGLNELQN